ncbi:hypothetical protein PHMEG_00017615 [Phytophthora megakarya]|uniref:Uncharacterized protein n=1 Tax=Phytophthora megakarya TaxID=4795 RepID=A0A225VW30_9STRA|nr:hypothetical protein PHMEG_00017615 [Phytophthora megakarya]
MSLSDLAPANTRRVLEGAVKAFLKFLKDECVSWNYLEVCMQCENAARILERVVDKFGMLLAFKEGRVEQLLARYSVMQYYRQPKNWPLHQFPQCRTAVEKNLLKKCQVLDQHCMKGEAGMFVNKAPACTKKALRQMTEYLYSTAATAADYQDAAHLCLLWYRFERASDLKHLRKTDLSIGADDVFFVRFVRLKKSEEQGLSLFPDNDFATYPLLTIALALIIELSPTHSTPRATLTPATPSLDLIDHPEPVAQQGASGEQAKGVDALPGIHSYVNRVLD